MAAAMFSVGTITEQDLPTQLHRALGTASFELVVRIHSISLCILSRGSSKSSDTEIKPASFESFVTIQRLNHILYMYKLVLYILMYILVLSLQILTIHWF